MRIIICLFIIVSLASCSSGKRVISSRDSGYVLTSKSSVPKPSRQIKKIYADLQQVYGDDPNVIVVRVVNDIQVIIPSDSFFAVGQSTLSGNDALLVNFSNVLTNYRDALIRIECLTDSSGSSQGNLDLSKLRAEHVKQFLVDHSLPAENLSATGYGSQFPIADNATVDGKAKNRRVVLTISPSRE